jgi:hypothetical protein
MSEGPLRFNRRLHLPAVSCSLAVLLCELAIHPNAPMSFVDDGPYVRMVHTLVTSGHVVYNGWAAPMLVFQLYLAAALVKLFGFSFLVVRSSTTLIAMLTAFFFQRILVLADISELNATIGTLALVVSPIYLMLSATFLTDVFGLFAVLISLYGCLHALRSTTDRSTIAWLCFAIATNAVCGTSRQIAWLGILVMVPSALWLLRTRRRVFVSGAAANLLGVVFVFACLHWLQHQPYIVPEQLLPKTIQGHGVAKTFTFLLLDGPFLLLPLFALFLPVLWRRNRTSLATVGLLCAAYALISFIQGYPFLMEPLAGDWINPQGIYGNSHLQGVSPMFLPHWIRIFFTIASLGGLLGLLNSFFFRRAPQPVAEFSTAISMKRLAMLLIPIAAAYTALLLPRTLEDTIFDRYLLTLLAIAPIFLLRYYQQAIRTSIPAAGAILVLIMGAYGVVNAHNNFSFYRARVAIAAELRANGIPDKTVDQGWEHNLDVELEYANHINFPTIAVPAHAYSVTPEPPLTPCQMFWYDYTPHIHALYGVSFEPNACYGPAPFAPVHFDRWPYRTPGTLYVVHYAPAVKP